MTLTLTVTDASLPAPDSAYVVVLLTRHGGPDGYAQLRLHVAREAYLAAPLVPGQVFTFEARP